VFGNPPFIGKKEQNPEQKADMASVFAQVKGAGVLDYVAAWYVKALGYIRANPTIEVAFVSTNSIMQGEQVGILWPLLLQAGVHIRFAHRTFKWSNEGKGNAAVHCVIVGFGLRELQQCVIWDYSDDIQADEGERIEAKRINPYLVDAPNVVITSRRSPVSSVPEMNYGSMPIDNGFLVLSPEEKRVALGECAELSPYIRKYIGGDELLNDRARYCFWFADAPPSVIRSSAYAKERIKQCRAFRSGRDREATQALAGTPQLFGEIRQPNSRYLALPKVSSENREFLPIGFEGRNVVASGSLLLIPGASLYHFGVLNGAFHNAWMRAVCGRLESRYQYSASIVYNNFPWPEPTGAQREKIEQTAQAILDARANHKGQSLADLYDPTAMPADLRKAHQDNDKAVDAAYGYKGEKSDARRVAFLFERYAALTSLLPVDKAKKKTAKR
jgi:hypothetical protein